MPVVSVSDLLGFPSVDCSTEPETRADMAISAKPRR